MKKKIAISIVAVALVLCCAIGGTLAWLTAQTGPVTNTFTVGNIEIELTETPAEYKVIPGSDIKKDPRVTVKKGSEACYLFVEITEENWSDGLTYSVENGWNELQGNAGVYYRKVSATTTEDVSFPVLVEDKVHAADTLTRAALQEMQNPAPTLTFKAYAVQSERITDAATAWDHRNG